MSKHLGDFDAAAVLYGKFTSYRPSTGAPFTLAGTPVLSVYKDNSVTQSTAGVTLTVDFDAVTGLNHFAIDTSADGTFYSAGSFFDLVVTTGTVDSVSLVGSVVASFTIRKTSALKPTTAGQTLDVAATGEAGLDFNNIKDATGAHTLTNIRVPSVTLADTLTTYTGNTPQTGDAFARAGAPVGASISADVAAVKADTVTLTTGTIAELSQAQPPANPTLVQAVMMLYMALRNGLTTDATSKKMKNDAGTVIYKKALSDDGVTYTEAKVVTGP